MATEFLGQGSTVISQGRFVSNGQAQNIVLPSGFSWIRVINETAAYDNTSATDLGVEYYYQDNMDVGRGVIWIKLGSNTDGNHPITMGQIDENEGFTPFDSSGNPLGGPVTITAVADGTSPLISTNSTAGLTDGSIVRITGTIGTLNISGYDWAINNITEDTSFSIAAVIEQAIGGTSTVGTYRIVQFNPLFYPTDRFICDVDSVGNTTVLTLTVPSGYLVGQRVRVYMPSDFGMTQIDQMEGTILDVNDALNELTITLNINSSSFDPFVFPLAASRGRYSPAMVVPIGINTAQALGINPNINILNDSMTNTGVIGVTLAGGIFSPGGANTNQMSWIAGTSYSNNIVTPD